MQLKNIFTDDEAVSPVIGVILMVAITVILAAVIGAFVLGIGGSQEKVPSASFTFEKYEAGDDTANDDVRATHEGGETISESNLQVKGDCTNAGYSGTGDITAGTTRQVGADCTSGNELRIVWSSSQSDKSSVLGEFTF